MRHVAIAEAKDGLSKLIAAGEEVAITRHGREVARLVPSQQTDEESRKTVFDTLQARRDDLRQRGVAPVTHADILNWVAEGRR